MTQTLRMPITTASRKGVSALASESADRRVALTSHGRVVAYVDSPQRAEADMQKLRGAAWEVLRRAANLYSDRSEKHSLSEVGERLGIDIDELRDEIAQERAQA